MPVHLCNAIISSPRGAQIEPDAPGPQEASTETQQYRPDELPQLKDGRRNLFRHNVMRQNNESLDEMRHEAEAYAKQRPGLEPGHATWRC